MGIFDGLQDAQMPGGGRFFTDGVYLVDVILAKSGESQQGKGAYVAIEAKNVETLVEFPAGRISDIDGSVMPASCVAGETLSNVIMMRTQPAASNIKGFLVAATGLTPDQITSAVAEKAFGGDGKALAGVRLIARAATIKTKAGRPFTKVTWERPQVPAE